MMSNRYFVGFLVAVSCLVLFSFMSRFADATPTKTKVQKQNERVRKLRERRLRRRTKPKRTLRKNFQVKPTKKVKKRPKIHKNPKKPLTKHKKCNKICQYHKLRFMMLLETANDYGDSHYIEKGSFNKRTTIKKRKKK